MGKKLDTVGELTKELVAGPSNWKKNESKQMRAIHKAYRDAMTRDENAIEGSTRTAFDASVTGRLNFESLEQSVTGDQQQSGANQQDKEATEQAINFVETQMQDDRSSGIQHTTVNPEQQVGLVRNDREWYLPRDSCLRSIGGEMLKPRNPPFKDFNAFVISSNFEEWKPHFQANIGDRYLVETAESITAHICTAQSRRELRVRHGSVPLGRFIRSKREHVTPLALVMHELKLWATHKLRTASIYEKETYLDIDRRIRYLTNLQKKEVWGPAAMPLHSGMRPIAHDKLFRLLLGAREDLSRARDYAYRGYCRRSSREKLAKIGNSLKNVIMHGMKICSCLLSVHENLSDPKARRLQATDLLNSVHNQSFVDYNNIANVCLRGLCEVPLFRMAILGEFPRGYYLEELDNWKEKNLFCRPLDSDFLKLEILEDDERSIGIPGVYKDISQRLKEEIKVHDKHAKLPLSRKQLYKLFRKSFGPDTKVVEILRKFSMCLAALQDMVPSCFASQVFWDIAGEGGNFTVYDTLRSQVIQVMSNTIERVFIVQASLKNLFEAIGEVVDQHKDLMEKKRLRTKKSEYEPPWLSNHQLASVELFPLAKKCFNDTYQQLMEVMKDAFEYSLSQNELNERVEACKKTARALLQGSSKESIEISGPMRGNFNVSKFVDVSSADWLNVTGTNPSLEPVTRQWTSFDRIPSATLVTSPSLTSSSSIADRISTRISARSIVPKSNYFSSKHHVNLNPFAEDPAEGSEPEDDIWGNPFADAQSENPAQSVVSL